MLVSYLFTPFICGNLLLNLTTASMGEKTAPGLIDLPSTGCTLILSEKKISLGFFHVSYRE